MKQIKLTQNKEALVDDEDYTRLNQYKWHTVVGMGGNYYAARWVRVDNKRVCIKMHRDILNVTDPAVLVDHEDRDGLNNQKYNIRLSNKSLNAINSARIDKATGIRYDKSRNRFKAFGARPTVYLGTFRTEQEALDAVTRHRAL